MSERMVYLAGLPFEVEDSSSFVPEERAYLDEIGTGHGRDDVTPFRLAIADRPLFDAVAPPSLGTAARIDCTSDSVRLVHAEFQAELRPRDHSGVLYRARPQPYALMAALRTAMTAILPLHGGFVLHAGGVATADGGFAFFGPSGAGKTTLMGRAQSGVISDEEVIVAARPATLMANGFWGALAPFDAPREPVCATALVQLAKGPTFSLSRLARGEALQTLMGSLRVYPLKELFDATLTILGDLVESVPLFRMAWSPEAPVWEPFLEVMRRIEPDREQTPEALQQGRLNR